MKNKIACIILAAGKGKRMKSDLPKVLHPICGRPMIGYVLDLARELKFAKTVVVLGHKHELVRKEIPKDARVVRQTKLLGTGDAVKKALGALGGFKGDVLVLCADIPLLRKQTIKDLIDAHVKLGSDATILAAELDKPDGYGRILRDEYSSISGIIEDKDADEFQKDIKEINTGIIIFRKESLNKALRCVKPNNKNHEYYLTDTIGILHKNNLVVTSVKIKDINESIGINSRVNLAKANKIMRQRINQKHMDDGVAMVDPDSVFIDYDVKIGSDCIIYPFTVIDKSVKIGKRCQVGPFAHLREGTVVDDDVVVGNFLEIVRSKISSKVFIKHFGYIGDSHVGKEVNIGAGSVTANFNGKRKNNTLIKDKAFIGSNSVLVAPVKIGKGAVVGAGSVVTSNHNVADAEVVVGVPARRIKNK